MFVSQTAGLAPRTRPQTLAYAVDLQVGDVLDTDRHVRVYLLAVEAVQRARMADGVPSILITASAEPGCAVLRIDLPGASAEGAAAVARGLDRRAQELDARTSTGFPWEARFA